MPACFVDQGGERVGPTQECPSDLIPDHHETMDACVKPISLVGQVDRRTSGLDLEQDAMATVRHRIMPRPD